MFLSKSRGPRTATLSDGSVLTLSDLPPSDTRWVASRKAAVVYAVAHHLLTQNEALRRYDLAEEEFASWEAGISTHGINALKVTALQRYRRARTEAMPRQVNDEGEGQ